MARRVDRLSAVAIPAVSFCEHDLATEVRYRLISVAGDLSGFLHHVGSVALYSNRAGAKCIVHSDGNIPEASRIWQTRVAAHLEVADAQVHLTHPGSDVQLGDDVWIGQQVM